MLILGLLRKRKEDKKEFSMTNPDLEKCYYLIEKLSELSVRKNLKIETPIFPKMRDKEGYKNIPNLIVLVAKSLTGYKMDIEIDINETTDESFV